MRDGSLFFVAEMSDSGQTATKKAPDDQVLFLKINLCIIVETFQQWCHR